MFKKFKKNRIPLFCSLPLTLNLLVLTILIIALPAFATIIPIEEEFVLAQQLHVDASWSAIAFTLQDETGLLDTQSTMNYQATFDISVDPAGDFFGTYSGMLTGEYLGEAWEITYNSEMSTVLAAVGVKVKTFTLTSSGKWKKGDFAGKSFTDSGTLTEKANNKADMDIEINTEGETQKIFVTARDLDKTKADGKLTLKGKITVKEKELDLTFVLDQATKKFTSLAEYGIFGVDVLKNTGTFTVVPKPQGQGFTGTTSFDVQMVPEPATILLFGLGGLGLRRRRKV